MAESLREEASTASDDRSRLRNLLESFCKTAIEILKEAPVPTKTLTTWSLKRSDAVEKKQIEVPNYDQLLRNQANALTSAPSYTAVALALTKVGTFSAAIEGLVHPPERLDLGAHVVLLRVLEALFQRSGGVRWVQHVFDELWQELSAYVFELSELRLLRVPLIDLRCDLDEVELGPNVRILKVDAVQGAKLSEALGIRLSVFERPEFTHVLEIRANKKRDLEVSEEIAWDNSQELVLQSATLALRVLGYGHFSAHESLEVSSTFSPGSSLHITHRMASGRSASPSMQLRAEQTQELRRYFELVSKSLSSSDKSLKVVLKRFSSAVGSHDPEDKLIDLMIAAEALFLGEPGAELNYRFQVRVGHFLGTDKQSRLNWSNVAKAAYGQRSKLMHGSNPDDPVKLTSYTTSGKSVKPISFQDFVEKVEFLLRTSIQRILMLDPEERPSAKDDFWDQQFF